MSEETHYGMEALDMIEKVKKIAPIVVKLVLWASLATSWYIIIMLTTLDEFDIPVFLYCIPAILLSPLLLLRSIRKWMQKETHFKTMAILVIVFLAVLVIFSTIGRKLIEIDYEMTILSFSMYRYESIDDEPTRVFFFHCLMQRHTCDRSALVQELWIRSWMRSRFFSFFGPACYTTNPDICRLADYYPRLESLTGWGFVGFRLLVCLIFCSPGCFLAWLFTRDFFLRFVRIDLAVEP